MSISTSRRALAGASMPRGGAAVDDHTISAGQSLTAPPKTCRGCRHTVGPDAQFCAICGRSTHDATEVETQASWSRPRTNGLSIAALVLGLVGGCFGVGSVLAIIFGHRARGQIRRSAGTQGGTRMATAGLVLGYLSLALISALLIASLVARAGHGTSDPTDFGLEHLDVSAPGTTIRSSTSTRPVATTRPATVADLLRPGPVADYWTNSLHTSEPTLVGLTVPDPVLGADTHVARLMNGDEIVGLVVFSYNSTSGGNAVVWFGVGDPVGLCPEAARQAAVWNEDLFDLGCPR